MHTLIIPPHTHHLSSHCLIQQPLYKTLGNYTPSTPHPNAPLQPHPSLALTTHYASQLPDPRFTSPAVPYCAPTRQRLIGELSMKGKLCAPASYKASTEVKYAFTNNTAEYNLQNLVISRPNTAFNAQYTGISTLFRQLTAMVRYAPRQIRKATRPETSPNAPSNGLCTRPFEPPR